MKTEVRKAQRLGDVYIHTSKLKGESGITLVALIITIIVLIILSVVTIMYLIDHRMIMKTVVATEKYASEQEKEGKLFNDIYDVVENAMQNIENGTFNGWEGEKPNPEITMPKRDGTWDETRGVNVPKLEGTNLIAVYYDDSAEIWKDLTESSSKEEWDKWYDYADTSEAGKENKSKWANARSKDRKYVGMDTEI